MIVSNFELLLNRIANVTNLPASVTPLFRRVVQGYFLTITNLDKVRTGLFRLKLTIPNSNGNRIINPNNVDCFFDNGIINNYQLPINRLSIPTSTAKSLTFYSESFEIAPKQTGIVLVLPKVTAFITNPNPDLEIRGFVELEQVRQSMFSFSTPAIDVLVTPETRGTFLDNAYPTTNTVDELDFDQLAYSLPIASGQAKNTVEALPSFIIPPILSDKITLPELVEKFSIANPDIEKGELQALFEQLSAIKENGELMKIIRKMES